MGALVGIALVWFIIEMLIWYLIAQLAYGAGWWVFMWFVVAAVIGIGMIKKTVQILNPMAQSMKSGVIPNPATTPSENTITKSIATGVAGLLLLLPGILSDMVALLLLLPFVQRKLTNAAKTYAMNNQQKMMDMMARQMGGTGGFGAMGGSPFGTNNPFGANSPFGSNNPFGGNSPFGGFGGTTVDGEAKAVKKDIKKLPSANDD